jgi:hypothetical protein
MSVVAPADDNGCSVNTNDSNTNDSTNNDDPTFTTTDTTSRMQRFTHTFDLGSIDSDDDDDDDNNEEQMIIHLDGYEPTDYYATNLTLTGQANWFGSLNMCHLMAAEYKQMFISDKSTICSVLELGSGIGRAGIMAAKVLQLLVEEQQAAVPHEDVVSTTNICLTDGEPALMPILEHNCTLNELVRGVDCQLLRWGHNVDLEAQKGAVFDVILGADLIYGDRDDVPKNVRNLFTTVCALLVNNKTETTTSDAAGKFYLAFTKRNTMSPESLLEIAKEEFGLRGTMHDDFCFDIWDNNVDPESLFWRDCIFVFERVQKDTEDSEGVSAGKVE